MKKKFAAFVLCVICLLSAAGCGQTKTDEQTPPAADQSTTTDDYLTTISGIILTGTGARLIGLPPVLASSINKMVRIGDPFIRFKLSKEVERQNIVAHAVDLGGVLGLVIGKKPR